MAVSPPGSARIALAASELEGLKKAGALILDPRRQRPNYFDGRFLTAADLTNDQNYQLSRLTDLARGLGQGVSEGLLVSQPVDADPSRSPSALRISAGWGLTGAGELVRLPQDLTVDVGALAEIRSLNQRFGLAPLPAEPQRTLTGLFVLALRPVEFSAGPIASYPTGLTGERQVEDGFLVEATAVTLMPYGDGGQGFGEEQRRQVAREIFLFGENRLAATGVLPLAMVALSRGVVQWLDPWLLRRELGAEGRGGGLFSGSRARQEAQLQQYRQQLDEVLAQGPASGGSFAAAQHFALLPPVGPMPREAILLPPPADDAGPTVDSFQQLFFPPEIDTELAIVPEDELAAVIEDSLALPPIDLTLTAAERDAIAVAILLPLPRARLQDLLGSLLAAGAPLRRPLRAVAPGQLARRLPIAILGGLALPATGPTTTAPEDGSAAVTGLWRRELERLPRLWFARQRLHPDRQPLLLTEVR